MTPAELTTIRRRAGLLRWASPERAARRLEVARRFRAGEDSGVISRALGISKSTVFDDLRRIAPELLAERRRERAGKPSIAASAIPRFAGPVGKAIP